MPFGTISLRMCSRELVGSVGTHSLQTGTLIAIWEESVSVIKFISDCFTFSTFMNCKPAGE